MGAKGDIRNAKAVGQLTPQFRSFATVGSYVHFAPQFQSYLPSFLVPESGRSPSPFRPRRKKMTYSQFDPAAQNRVPWNFGAKIGRNQPITQNCKFEPSVPGFGCTSGGQPYLCQALTSPIRVANSGKSSCCRTLAHSSIGSQIRDSV